MNNKIIGMAILCAPATAICANPEVSNGIATFTKSRNIGTKYPVPNHWKKIVINRGVTLTGSFFVAQGSRTTKNLTITGIDPEKSTIVGFKAHDHNGTKEAREKSAIRYGGPGTLTVKKLTSKNSEKFHIWGISKVVGDELNLIQPDKEHTSDGFHAKQNSFSIIRNSFINVHDDAVYVTETKTIDNVEIVQNKNGAPFQIGWDDREFTSDARATISRSTVISNFSSRYNQGVVSWAENESLLEDNTVKIRINGLTREKMNANAIHAPMYQFGTSRYVTDRGVLNSTGTGACDWKNSVKRFNKSNSKLQIPDC